MGIQPGGGGEKAYKWGLGAYKQQFTMFYIFAVFIYYQSVNVKVWASCGVVGCK